jgi:DNA-binding transcriptional LysR family regulator
MHNELMDWDHLCTFEAVIRLGSLTAAARSLGISQSTVSRQLAALEDDAGSPLLVRDTPVVPTDRGAALLRAVAPMVDHALAARSVLDAMPDAEGEVVLTTVNEILRWELIHRLPGFWARHPRIRLAVVTDNRTTSLAAGEADLALRMARPERGDLVARKLSDVRYGVFAAEGLEPGPGMPWLGLAGTLADIPEQRAAERVFGNRPARLLVEDVEALGLAVQAGLGAAVLPTALASRLTGVSTVPPRLVGGDDSAVIPTRELWLVVHRSRRDLPPIRAVVNWLADELPERPVRLDRS